MLRGWRGDQSSARRAGRIPGLGLCRSSSHHRRIRSVVQAGHRATYGDWGDRRSRRSRGAPEGTPEGASDTTDTIPDPATDAASVGESPSEATRPVAPALEPEVPTVVTLPLYEANRVGGVYDQMNNNQGNQGSGTAAFNTGTGMDEVVEETTTETVGGGGIGGYGGGIGGYGGGFGGPFGWTRIRRLR